jgi:hypothetical protein
MKEMSCEPMLGANLVTGRPRPRRIPSYASSVEQLLTSVPVLLVKGDFDNDGKLDLALLGGNW